MNSLRDALLGVWVAMHDDEPQERLQMLPVEYDDEAVLAGGRVFAPHLLLAGLWRASGGGAYAFSSGRVLWLRAADTEWQPYCRPGLDELLPAPHPPETRFTLDAISTLLRANRQVINFDVHAEARGDHSRWRLTVWYGVLGELQAWDRDGLFDVCELN